jgi:hypothetical protein
MPGSRVQLLTAVQAYLHGGLEPERTAAGLRHLGELQTLLARDLGRRYESRTLSLKIRSFDGESASVGVRRVVFPDGRSRPGTAVPQYLTIHAAYDGRWNVADLELDGAPLTPRIRRVVVEAGDAEGLRIAAVGVDDVSGARTVTVAIRNVGTRHWRLQCVGSVWRWGPLRFLEQAGRRRFRGHGAIDYPPGCTHAFAVRVPPDAERIWLKLGARRLGRSLLVALSFEDRTGAVAMRPLRRLRRAAPLYGGFAALVAYIGARKGAIPALEASTLIPLLLVYTDLCVRRLERKLTRLRRAQSA